MRKSGYLKMGILFLYKRESNRYFCDYNRKKEIKCAENLVITAKLHATMLKSEASTS